MFDLSKLGEMVKNAHQMQEKLAKEMALKTAEASAGGDLVRVQMNGQFQVTFLQLDPSLLAMNDIALMQDLIQSAINNASQQIKALISEQAKNVAQHFNLPVS